MLPRNVTYTGRKLQLLEPQVLTRGGHGGRGANPNNFVSDSSQSPFSCSRAGLISSSRLCQLWPRQGSSPTLVKGRQGDPFCVLSRGEQWPLISRTR